MAATFLAKRASINISKASAKDHSRCPDSAARLSGTCFSTSYECAERTKQHSLDMDEDTRPPGAAQFVADTAKEGMRKATEMADTVGDAERKTADGAWKAPKDANQSIRETVVGENEKKSGINDNGNGNGNGDVGVIEEDPVVEEMQNIDEPVDTVEYRNIEVNFEELKKTEEEAT